MDKKSILVTMTIVLFIVVSFLLFRSDLSNISDLLTPAQSYVGLFISQVVLTASIIFPLGAEPFVIVAGGFLNPIVVGVVSGIGAAIGESMSYVIGLGGGYVVKANQKKKFDRIKLLFEKHGFIMIPIFAFTPLPFDILGIVAGLIRYDYKRFFIGVLIGKIPRGIILAYIGYFGVTLIGL